MVLGDRLPKLVAIVFATTASAPTENNANRTLSRVAR